MATRAQRKAERPGEILEAALEEFVLNGYAATRLEDVAVRAGVTKGTIYFYFDSKERVFECVIQELSKPPMEEFRASEAEWTEDLHADIGDLLARLYRFVTENRQSREILRLLIAEAARFPALVERHCEEFMEPVVQRLRDRFAVAVRQGELRPDWPDELPKVVLGPVLALNVMMLLFAHRLELDPDRYMAAHRATLLEGILAGGAGPPAPPESEGWSDWRRYPDPRRREHLDAPLGPGLFELRLGPEEPLLIGAGRSVVGRMTTLVPAEIAAGQRRSSSRRRFLTENLDRLAYRTLATDSYGDAVEHLAEFDPRGYRFGHMR